MLVVAFSQAWKRAALGEHALPRCELLPRRCSCPRELRWPERAQPTPGTGVDGTAHGNTSRRRTGRQRPSGTPKAKESALGHEASGRKGGRSSVRACFRSCLARLISRLSARTVSLCASHVGTRLTALRRSANPTSPASGPPASASTSGDEPERPSKGRTLHSQSSPACAFVHCASTSAEWAAAGSSSAAASSSRSFCKDGEARRGRWEGWWGDLVWRRAYTLVAVCVPPRHRPVCSQQRPSCCRLP